LIVELIAVVGLHWILKYGSILNHPRDFVRKVKLIDRLFSCSLCLGFWCGVIGAVYLGRDVVVYGMCGAAVCWVADNINIVLQRVDIELDK
jgi:uncharacterized membrane protein YoaK (UPF0700 family)